MAKGRKRSESGQIRHTNHVKSPWPQFINSADDGGPTDSDGSRGSGAAKRGVFAAVSNDTEAGPTRPSKAPNLSKSGQSVIKAWSKSGQTADRAGAVTEKIMRPDPEGAT